MTVWRTRDGDPYSKIVEVYGVLVSADSEAYRSKCAAQHILSKPRDARSTLMDKMVDAACKRRDFATYEAWQAARVPVRLALEQVVTREWTAQKGEAA